MRTVYVRSKTIRHLIRFHAASRNKYGFDFNRFRIETYSTSGSLNLFRRSSSLTYTIPSHFVMPNMDELSTSLNWYADSLAGSAVGSAIRVYFLEPLYTLGFGYAISFKFWEYYNRNGGHRS